MECKNTLPSRFQTPHPQTPIRIRILFAFVLFFYVKLSFHKTKQKQNRAKKDSSFAMRWKNGAKILCAHCNIHVCKRISFPTPFSIARHTHKHTHFEWKSERVVARIYAKNIGREISNPNTYIMYKWLRWFYFLVFRRSFANLFFRFVSNKKMEKTRTRTSNVHIHTTHRRTVNVRREKCGGNGKKSIKCGVRTTTRTKQNASQSRA